METNQVLRETTFSTKDIVIIGMLAAVCTVATYIKVPAGNGAMVHLGSAALFTSALLFGGTKAGLGGAIGSAMFDIIGGFSPYTLWSFIIKGLAGLLIGLIANSKFSRKLIAKLTEGKAQSIQLFIEAAWYFAAVLAGAVWTLVGYLGAWTVVIGSFEAAMGNAIFSILTSAAGIIVSIPLTLLLKKPLTKYRGPF